MFDLSLRPHIFDNTDRESIDFTGTDFMKFNSKLRRIWAGTLLTLFAFASLGSTGCTVYNSGMTLPNPHYHKNIPQYFPTGTEFPFSNEAANLQAADSDVQRGY